MAAGSDSGCSPCGPRDKKAAVVVHGLDPSRQADLAHPKGMEVDQPGKAGILEVGQGELSSSQRSLEDPPGSEGESNGPGSPGNGSRGLRKHHKAH